MPMTKNGAFMLREDAQHYAASHASMAATYERLGEKATDPAVKASAMKLMKAEQEKAEYYRAVARGDFNKVSA